MNYIPYVWRNNPAGGTPVVAARLNALEQGLAAASNQTTPDAVLTIPQTLTGPQQTQVRTNIGAPSVGDVDGKAPLVHTHTLAGLTDVSTVGVTDGQILVYDFDTGRWVVTDPRGDHTCRWDGIVWEPRNPAWLYGVLFLSTNDPTAPAPDDPNLKIGDRWGRHPDAT